MAVHFKMFFLTCKHCFALIQGAKIFLLGNQNKYQVYTIYYVRMLKSYAHILFISIIVTEMAGQSRRLFLPVYLNYTAYLLP